MSKVKRLNVITPQGFSGELSRGSQFSFAYETADATREVSLVMPYDPTPSVSNVLHPIFDMNVPEGFLADQIKRRMAKHMQVDEMRLLSVIGVNQIGRLTYHPEALQTVQLAPVFDVTTTTVYENYNPKSGRSLVDRTLAIKMNKVKTYPGSPATDRVWSQALLSGEARIDHRAYCRGDDSSVGESSGKSERRVVC
ncbi:HipA N-terminal domain-containing protein [Pseudomonas sp. GW456-12-1-14-TSB6]|uniref:HipA N-terminal domain-containing protein n=1 Tax=unclassified Pseudomonas TaxID=196821 RepID=UPI0021151CBB|nr:HipA N-terminal domain-containing protein [Pseudomonas sp. GW456-12-1-14-TSB6]